MTTQTAVTALTPAARAYFFALARDAGNWGGRPLIGGNVKQGPEQNGYLTACKKAGLIETDVDEGCTWASFTAAGVSEAAAHGIDIDC